MTILVADCLGVNKLVLKIASWVAFAMALWRGASSSGTTINLVMRTLAARVAVLAFGDELVDLRLPDNVDPLWLSQGGREMAAAYLLPRAEAEEELQRLADAVKRASVSRAL
jgi:hypothetical protein